MAERSRHKKAALQLPAREERANCIAEWFGHRVYPHVVDSREAIHDQMTKRCPFLSRVIAEKRQCVKPAAASGVCTISSHSNGPRQDWLACPYRALDDGLLNNAARRIFDVEDRASLIIVAAPTLEKADVRTRVLSTLESGGVALAYLQDKLGGEIQLGPTDRSPQVAFDITFVELLKKSKTTTLGWYGILEVQTMDFHGSFKHAVKRLESGLDLHPEDFATQLARNTFWMSEKVEGPNIANVFKRTFYQMMMKFQMAGHGACAGSALAIPASVWDSWQRHLGAPSIAPGADGVSTLAMPTRKGAPPPHA